MRVEKNVRDGYEGKDDPGNGAADDSEIYRWGAPEQEQGELKHHWKTLDGDVEVPLFKPIQFALLVPTCRQQNFRGS